jgi:hypothetical protein
MNLPRNRNDISFISAAPKARAVQEKYCIFRYVDAQGPGRPPHKGRLWWEGEVDGLTRSPPPPWLRH